MHHGLIYAPTTPVEFDEYAARFDGINAIGLVARLNTAKTLVGFVNIRNIARVGRATGRLGYGGFTAHSGHGYVAEAVRLTVRYAFEELGLDRLEADIQAANTPSRKVVEQAGFRRDSAAPVAIRIAGEWREHERWVINALQ